MTARIPTDGPAMIRTRSGQRYDAARVEIRDGLIIAEANPSGRSGKRGRYAWTPSEIRFVRWARGADGTEVER